MTSGAIAVIIVKERHIVEAFERAGATAPEAAVTLDALGVSNRIAARRLRERAILREAAPGRFYVDVPGWEALRRTRRRLAAMLLLMVVLVGVWAALQTRAR